MEKILLIVIAGLVIVSIFLIIIYRSKRTDKNFSQFIDILRLISEQIQSSLSTSLKDFSAEQRAKFDAFNICTEKRLDEMRFTVDEKLQRTLNERLGQSFDLVGKQLENVQKGLGEMQTLAQDVGSLKKVLTNVRMTGALGEIQLAMLLEQLLAPDQYQEKVKIKPGSTEYVEFVVKIPSRNDYDSVVLIPIDAKFPKEVFEHLQNAYEEGNANLIATAKKNFEYRIKKMSKDIMEKYIDPPITTDFAIMFLPFEGIYAEVVRNPTLFALIQREYKVVITGPTTLAAILNSFQVGFRTLAIQKRSGEVWQVLTAVKKEFETFGGLLEKAQKNLLNASDQLDEVMGKRTRAIQKQLKNIETLPDQQSILNEPW